MKHIYKVSLIFSLLLAVLSPIVAQELVLSEHVETENGLRVDYFSHWDVDIAHSDYILLKSDQGWEFDIQIGDYAVQNFANTDPKQPADEAIIAFTDAFLDDTDDLAFMPMYLYVYHEGLLVDATYSTPDAQNIPVRVAAFNLPDGTVAIVHMSNPETQEALFSNYIAQVEFSMLIDSITQGTTADDSASFDIYAGFETAPEGSILYADLDENQIRLGEGITFNYPDGWKPEAGDEDFYSKYHVNMLYGDSILIYDALLTITLNESDSFSIDEYRELLLPMTAIMFTDIEDFDPEQHLITETLDNGIVIQYLESSADDTLTGNVYLIILDDQQWIYASAYIIGDTKENIALRLQEVHDIIKSVHVVAGEKPLIFGVNPDETISYEGFDLKVEQITCHATGRDGYVSEDVPYALLACPANCLDSSGNRLWGTDIYTDDSTICAAAIHSGAITNQSGGIFLTQWVEGQEQYLSSLQNGIEAMSWGSWGQSFAPHPFNVYEYLTETGE